jgi:hypothetical protein
MDANTVRCAFRRRMRLPSGPLAASAVFLFSALAWHVTAEGASTPLLVVNSPASIAGSYTVGTAVFGPPLTAAGVTGDVVLALDAATTFGPLTTDACTTLTNADVVAGRIALVDRGICAFTQKVRNAQDAGAIAVIVVNNTTFPPTTMGGTDPTITIPSVMISQADGNLIKAELEDGVNATLLVVADIGAVVEMHPQTINKKARGQWISALIEFPDGTSVADIDVSTITIQAIDPVTSVKLSVTTGAPTDIGDGNANGLPDLTVKFDRATVQSWFAGETLAIFRVEGRLLDGRSFEGDAAARIIDAGTEHTNEAAPGSVQN